VYFALKGAKYSGQILGYDSPKACQGYEVEKNILYEDNKSAIILEINGKKSSGKRTRALIRLLLSDGSSREG
jgi:hypothetical protein